MIDDVSVAAGPAGEPNLERIARAAAGGYDREQAVRVVVEEVYGAMDCDQAFLLTPAPRGDAVCVEAVAPARAAIRPGQVWTLGESAPRVFDHCFCHSDSVLEPFNHLARHLRDQSFTSWVGLPLRSDVRERPVGVLGLASCTANAHLGWTDALRPLAAAATEALAGNTEQAEDPSATPEAHDYERTQALGNMAFGVSHSLGNIFGAILGNLHFLWDESSGGRRDELLQRIESSACAGAEMMNSLGGFVKPADSGVQRMDLSVLAADVLGLTRRLCATEGVDLTSELDDGCVVWGQPARLRECLVNIVFNALWAAGRGGHVQVSTQAGPDACEVCVSDDGPGMTDEVRRRATEPFFTTRGDGHDGLGLSVARGIVVAHRGQMTIHTKPEGGTRVAMRLPVASHTAEQMTDQLMTEALAQAGSQ